MALLFEFLVDASEASLAQVCVVDVLEAEGQEQALEPWELANDFSAPLLGRPRRHPLGCCLSWARNQF